MVNERQIYILRTSGDVYNKFSINNSNSLIHEEIKDGEVVSKNNIADNIKEYSAAIDREDKIHIIFTEDNIDLKYMVLQQNNSIVNIVSSKKGNILRCISIKIILTTPHIFYTLTDVQNNNHIICQSFFAKGSWQCSEIFRAFGPKYIQPYLLEIHRGEVYILFYLYYAEGKLGLYKLDSVKAEWVSVDTNIELKDSSNISFFISPKNMLVIAYNKLINRNFQTIIFYKSLCSKTYDTWKSKVLSTEGSNTLKPSILVNNDEYYMTWLQGAKVVLIRSKDLIYWENVNTLDKYFDDYQKCFYMRNQSEDFDLKMNCAYLSNTINSYPIINLSIKNELPKANLYFDSGESIDNFLVKAKNIKEEPSVFIEETNEFMEEPNDFMEEPNVFKDESNIFIEEFNIFIKETNIFIEEPGNFLEEKIKVLDRKLEKKVKFLGQELEEKAYENNLMKKNINYLNNIITLNEEQIAWLNNAKTSSTQDINGHRNNFLDKIISFHKDTDVLLFSYNNKLWKLFRLIEEKDKLIDDLYKSINK